MLRLSLRRPMSAISRVRAISNVAGAGSGNFNEPSLEYWSKEARSAEITAVPSGDLARVGAGLDGIGCSVEPLKSCPHASRNGSPASRTSRHAGHDCLGASTTVADGIDAPIGPIGADTAVVVPFRAMAVRTDRHDFSLPHRAA